MKTLTTLTLVLALTGCYLPQENAFRKITSAFTDMCVPHTISVTTQSTDDTTMIMAVCTRVK